MSSVSFDQPTSGKTPAASRAELARLHEFKHWPAMRLWPMLAAMLVLGAAAALAHWQYWPLLIIIWPAHGAVLFAFALAFHDASHNRLHPVHWLNEAIGHLTGSLSFIPLSVYRFAHARHHACVGTEGDPELWPFNTPSIARPWRVAAAFAEIVFGFIYTPFLFLRSVLVEKLSPRERRRIIRGYLACVATWAVILAVVYYVEWWSLLLVAAVVPLVISGMLQTLNKFAQHLGLHGKTVLGLTRTVVDEHKYAEWISAAMLYNDYHGTHHRYAKIPYYHLPQATPMTLAGATEPCPVFPSLASTVFDMLPCLLDPKVGPQWNES